MGEVAVALGDTIPDDVVSVLKLLALRGTMRDIASAIGRNERWELDLGVPSFHEIVDAGAVSCGLSWAEAIAAITCHLERYRARLG